jgi:very-short-patch-repair endonuclease
MPVVAYLEGILKRAVSVNRSSPLSVLRDGRSHPIDIALAEILTKGQDVTVADQSKPAEWSVYKRLLDSSKEALRTKGERSLHVICGRFKLPWPQDPTKNSLAPIYLLKAEVTKGADGVFKLKALDGSPGWELNPAIKLLMEVAQIGTSGNLPETIPVNQGFPAVKQQVDWLSSQCGKAASVDLGCRLANISSADIRIIKLLRDDAVRRSIAANDVIQAKVEGNVIEAKGVPVGDEGIESLGIVLPCDDSQLRVIQLADRALSLQVEGPPGTGKSQTIANIIASLVKKDKRVLFVCEKAVAVSQVRDRLDSVGLGPALLYLHDEETERRHFVDQVVDSLQVQGLPSAAPLDLLKGFRKKLNDSRAHFCSPLHPAGENVAKFEGLAAMVKLRRDLDKDLKQLDIPAHNALTFEKVLHLKRVVDEWMGMAGELADSKSPWNQVRGELFLSDSTSRHALEEAIQSHERLMPQLPELTERLVRLGYSRPLLSLTELSRALEVASSVINHPPAANELLACDALDAATVARLHAYWCELKQIEARGHPLVLADHAADVFGVSVEKLADVLRTDVDRMEWRDLNEHAAQELARVLEVVDRVQGMLRDFADKTGSAPADSLEEVEAAFLRFDSLKSLNVNVPQGWWAVSLDPVSIVSNWKIKVGEVINVCKASPWPAETKLPAPKVIDLRKLYAVSEAQFKELTECMDGMDGFFTGLFLPKARTKHLLRQIYRGSLPASLTGAEWQSLCRHCIEAHSAISHLVNVSSDIPQLMRLLDDVLNYPTAETHSKVLADGSLRNVSLMAERVRDLRADPMFNSVKPIVAAYWLGDDLVQSELIQNARRGIESIVRPKARFLKCSKISEIASILRGQIESVESFFSSNRVSDRTAKVTIRETLIAIKRASELRILLKATDKYAALRVGNGCWHLKAEADWEQAGRLAKWKDELYANIGSSNIDLNKSLWVEPRSLLSGFHDDYVAARKDMDRLFLLSDVAFSSFEASTLLVASLKDGLARRDYWLRKSHWVRCKDTVPELSDLWARFKAGEIVSEKAWRIFIFNFLRKCNDALAHDQSEHERLVAQFRDLDAKLTGLTVAELKTFIYAKQDQARAAYPGAYTEFRGIAGRARVMKTIRELIYNSDNLNYLLEAKSCWMMSPASLSAYLGADAFGKDSEREFPFDAVIFDEASQMRVLDAVFCMGFAKQTLIVGDRKQLPPTNFFKGSSFDGEEDEDAVESVLEEFGGVFNQQQDRATMVSLMTHYRSETPDLISFNNRRFYNDKLEICPPRQITGTGLNLVQVPTARFFDGVNRDEAAEVVKLVAEHVKRRPNDSLGVVVMNYKQMELIEELLIKQPAEVRAFTGDEQRWFLRNLENVQGDEADYIVLGLTYGRNDQDKFTASVLGPIIKSGGDRRLNVASSRSRKGMHVVTSLTTSDLAASSAESDGFKCFKDFIGYLEQAHLAKDFGITHMNYVGKTAPANSLLACDSDFEVQVAEYLGKKGIEVCPQYGAGKYRIDLVLRHKGQNVLAVECDGAAYHSTVTARTRDRARQQHLEARGWRFHRIWSRSWFNNSDEEGRKLLEAFHKACAASGVPVASNP